MAWGKFAVTNFALTSNVATLTGIIIAGNIPAVGDFISTQGQPFDVTDATITGVSINADSGIGTITYAATNADIGSVASGGIAKMMVADGLVQVDGHEELRKTCKIRAGQIVTLNDSRIHVAAPAA